MIYNNELMKIAMASKSGKFIEEYDLYGADWIVEFNKLSLHLTPAQSRLNKVRPQKSKIRMCYYE